MRTYIAQLSGCSFFEIKNGDELTPCIKHASYVTIGHNSSSTVGSSLSSKPRSKSHGPISPTLNFSGEPVRDSLIGARRDWEDKYRYFSRPFNLSDHACSAFESVRMRESFDRHCSSESPTVSEPSSCEKMGISNNAHKKSIASGMRDCGELVELSRRTAKVRGSSTAHAGYDWPRYKYFSSGMNNPSSGTMDKLLLTDARFAVAR